MQHFCGAEGTDVDIDISLFTLQVSHLKEKKTNYE